MHKYSGLGRRIAIFSPLINSADSCSFFFLSISLSIFPPFFDLHVIHLIYQVKGISGHQWGCVRVCAGVNRCARVCTSVHGCTGCVRVCMGVQWEGAGVGESMRVCGGVHRCAWLCAGVYRFALGYTCMCGMNFQNFFRRIESLHQRTLIRILYEFFRPILTCWKICLSLKKHLNWQKNN